VSRIEYDVVLVGASPSNLTLAFRLVEKATGPLRIAVLEKAKDIGGHLLSGAVSNPRVIQKLFPDWKESDFPIEGICNESFVSFLGKERWEDVPRPFMPPAFVKEGYAILSIADMAAYMATKITEKATEKEGAVVDFYPGFPARSVIFDGDKVVGVKVDDTGDDDKDNLYGKVTVFGDKGFISREIISKFNLRKGAQTWAVGVKEVWETTESYEGKVWHTAGYPLNAGHLGGGFIYGCKNNRLIVGMVMALDYADPNIEPPQVLQSLKKHPRVQEMLKGGKLVKYGASVLPEGGYYALPEKFAVDGAMLVGDALGTLDVYGFSGVDKAMETGYQAAEVITDALAKGDCSASGLASFKTKVMNSFVGKELYKSRYFRKAFHSYPNVLEKFFPDVSEHVDAGRGVVGAAIAFGVANPFTALGMLGAGKMINMPSGDTPFNYKPDRSFINPKYKGPRRPAAEGYDNTTVFSTADIVFYAHTHYDEENKHIDEFSKETCFSCIADYDRSGNRPPCVGDCTAEVHEILDVNGKRTHHMALENCVQCTTCEIVCPKENLRVNAALHGNGADFSGM
jgi:electron-transferring-flavoprotein dehydrogenase